MDEIMTYIQPELLSVSVVLYLLGMALKKSGRVPERYLPLVLCGTGIVLCGVWVWATTAVTGPKSAAMAAFTSVVQGTLVAGLAVFACRMRGRKNKGS